MNDTKLLTKARETILLGKLPARPATRIWSGAGLGMTCPVCGEPVTRNAPGLDLEFIPPPGSTGAHLSFAIHTPCFAAWEAECENVAAAVRPPQRPYVVAGRE